jgi:hypothetical protein
MAGGQRTLRSTTHVTDGMTRRDPLGNAPETRRVEDNAHDGTRTETSSLSDLPREDTQTTSTTLPIHPHERETQDPRTGDLRTTIANLLEALNNAELSGAPAREIEIRQRQFDRAVETLQRTQGGNTLGSTRPAFDEAGRIMRVLNNVQPKPKLGSEGKPPTTQQVDQWTKDIDTAFQYAQVLEDSVTRTHWIMGTIQFGIHRELIQQRINEGSIRTWADLRAEEQQLVQDPVFTRYENYHKFFTFEWRNDDSVNTFLMKLNKRESLLPRNFSKFDDGSEDHEFKIAFVWSKTPAPLRKEIQRNGALEHIKEWPEFERALRNAETAVEPLNLQTQKGDRTQGKRGPSSPPRRGFKRQNSRNSTPARSEPGKTSGDNRSARNNNAPNGGRWTPGDRGNQGSREGSQKPHWRHNASGENSQQNSQGKGKP